MSYTKPSAYDRFMGRWSARLAPAFLRFSQVRDGQHILDVGSGTGCLSRAAISFASNVRVTGVDPTPEYVAFAKEVVSSRSVQFQLGQAEGLSFSDSTFDAALALLVVQDFAEPRQAVSEMARVTRSGGIVAACTWDFEAGFPMLSMIWKAAEAVAPEAVASQRARSSAPFASLRDLETLWREGGLTNVVTETLDLPMPFASFDDYWQPFLEGSTPASSFAVALNAQTRGALARVLRDSIAGMQPNGSFVLSARAWAIRGATLG